MKSRNKGIDPDPGAALDRLAWTIATLRQRCAWTGALTTAALTGYLLEECHELIEAQEAGTPADVRGELGDVLFQVVLQARLAEEAGEFGLADVVRTLSEKLVRRNPHVFSPDGAVLDAGAGALEPGTQDLAAIERTWTLIKRAERAQTRTAPGQEQAPGEDPAPGAAPTPAGHAAGEAVQSILASVPLGLPALARAQKVLDRAARSGLAVGLPGEPNEEPEEEPEEEPDGELTETELGRRLLTLVRTARAHGLDAERALRGAVRNLSPAPSPVPGQRTGEPPAERAGEEPVERAGEEFAERTVAMRDGQA